MAKSKNITMNPYNFLRIFSLFYPISPRNNNSSKTPLKLSSSSSSPNLPLFFLFLLILFAFFTVSKLGISPHHNCPPNFPASFPSRSDTNTFSPIFYTSLSASLKLTREEEEDDLPRLSYSSMVPLPAHGISRNMTDDERDFWKQPDGAGYRPCLEFGMDYRRSSAKISQEKKRFLVVVASGGLNQQRNEIIDAVVIARILQAALVIPVLQLNLIWGDDSEFSDIFDAQHFKRTLQADVRVVSSLPSTHIVPKQTIVRQIPHDVTPQWIHSRFFRKLNDEGVLVLKGLDSKLSKNLPPDLQKLRCKVAFHALRFAPPIRELGDRLTRRMWIEGPYVALHLRLEKDVWVRTGCRTGLGPEVDRIIAEEQESRPEYLTGRLNINYDQRRLAGLCPLNAAEVARLLKALGAPRNARIYVAGGEPLGGTEALLPLKKEFPDVVTKESLAKEGELAPYINRSSALAAIDYSISLSSDVFMPSHGGNMGRAMQGHRAYIGHRKYIRPNKRAMLPYFEDATLSEGNFSKIIKRLHKHSLGQPQWRNNQRERDVIAYPVPECMCNS